MGEKQAGTAAWVLSKPVSRVSFVLAKLVSHTIGIGLIVVLVQGVLAYLLSHAVGQRITLLGWMAGLGTL